MKKICIVGNAGTGLTSAINENLKSRSQETEIIDTENVEKLTNENCTVNDTFLIKPSPFDSEPYIIHNIDNFNEPEGDGLTNKERNRGGAIHYESVRKDPKIGRNDLCPCGSGKKYKNCCLKN